MKSMFKFKGQSTDTIFDATLIAGDRYMVAWSSPFKYNLGERKHAECTTEELISNIEQGNWVVYEPNESAENTCTDYLVKFSKEYIDVIVYMKGGKYNICYESVTYVCNSQLEAMEVCMSIAKLEKFCER